MKKFLFISVFIGSITYGLGQTLPLPPEMIRVSVQPLTDMVTIEWKPSATHNLDSYVVFEYKNTGSSGWNYVPVLQINDTNAVKAVFSYPPVRQHGVLFFVAARKNYPSGPADSPPVVRYHKTIFMKQNYDSCHSKVDIHWDSYYGWFNNLEHYSIFQLRDGVGPELVKDNISPNDTSYSADVQPNSTYCFYVCAINRIDRTITSFSNDSCLLTKMAVPPAYINADYASFGPNSSNPVKLRFTIDSNSQLKKYQLYASDNPDNGFSPLGSPLSAVYDSVITQDNVAGNIPKYYKLQALNNCGNPSTVSNIATAMSLRGVLQASQVNLIWPEYQGWSDGVQQYNVYRCIGSNAPQLLGSTATNAFTDDLQPLIGQQNSGNVCYYIEAVSRPDNLRKVNHSLSSNYCVDLSESIFVPNAFTPNGDNVNDEFMPSFAFLPMDFALTIYNRYGFKVFETTDPLKGWDGTFGNGKKAPEGTYVYFIRFTSQTGNTIDKKGNVSLIYP